MTDGVTEAGRVDNELYGLGRLEKQFAEAADSAQQIVQGVLDDLAAFVDGASQRDDTCVICIRRAN